ncbi:hypothetical protein TNIN_99201 [Trichonephila inaurata madagascariensis]|uniref:Uncharacterized protein n=1 Tax=Trichonephila inaurata madagascariensis TaxID=2747483 RepID=A0A8X6X3A7_9ARAC|nr:hypothetical protein TNIN_99201 [Trichonephila inaurata madagascariensis]
MVKLLPSAKNVGICKVAKIKAHASNCTKKASKECMEEIQCSDSMMDEVDQPPDQIQCLEDITKFISKTSDKDKIMIDLALVKIFYACNILFAVVESESFKNLILHIKYWQAPFKMLRTMKQMDKFVKSLVTNGWSNIYNEPIIASCIQVNGDLYVVNIENTGTTKKISDFYSYYYRKI